MKDCYLHNAHVCQILHCKKTKASQVIARLNRELSNSGYITVMGAVPKEYFCTRFGLSPAALDAALEVDQQATAQAR